MPGLGTVGSYSSESEAWTLVAATAGEKLLLHTPEYATDGEHGAAPGTGNGQAANLLVNRAITALATGRLQPAGQGGADDPAAQANLKPRDFLVIGTSSSVQGYDLQQNADTFFRDFPGGVSSLLTNTVSEGTNGWPTVLIGEVCYVHHLGSLTSIPALFWSSFACQVLTKCL